MVFLTNIILLLILVLCANINTHVRHNDDILSKLHKSTKKIYSTDAYRLDGHFEKSAEDDELKDYRREHKIRRNHHVKFNRSNDTRRNKKKEKAPASSSSLEMPYWKDEWKERWSKMKAEVIKLNLTSRGDVVNMIAARPWGIACGDPDQKDVPWGSCTLPQECESEFRIFRGDIFCGRTEFVCCGLLLNTYDMYHGFDASLAESSLHTSSEELKQRHLAKKNKKHKKSNSNKKARQQKRSERKKALRRIIRKTVKEIGRILNKTYKYGTSARQRKTKQLKKFVDELKKRYKKDQHTMKDVHDLELFHIDKKLKKGVDQVRDVNREFIYNSTFRKWVLNQTLSKEGAKFLRQQYPELYNKVMSQRRSNNAPEQDNDHYDIEYGLLYT